MKQFTGIMLILLLFAISCGRQVRPEYSAIRQEFDRISRMVEQDRSRVRRLENYRVADTGFFYILDREGTVVFHPEAVLIGRSFGSFPFVRAILEEKEGCLIYRVASRQQVVLFAPLNPREIICLTMELGEVRGDLPACREMELDR
jgi:hypothetical protein